MKKQRVLVFPCGSEIGLEINRSLSICKDIILYGASSVDDHGKFVYKNYISNVPEIDSFDFIDSLNRIINKFKIDFLFPAHDSVVLKASEYDVDIKCKVVTSPFETNKICRDKLMTYNFFNDYDFIPKVYDEFESIKDFPVFLKPRIGQGAKGTIKINDTREMNFFNPFLNDLLVLEYLPGDEYTVDCFTNKNRELLFIGQRKRNRIKDGISVNTSYCDLDKKVEKMARIINRELVFRGVWFFQVKIDSNGEYKLMEISSRVAGCMGLARNHGINMPLLSLYDFCGLDINTLYEPYNLVMDRALASRYHRDFDFVTIYIDFDDTLIISNKVNTTMMMFLYQCINVGKKIVLLTRHEGDITQSLNAFKIFPCIFDEIIPILDGKDKSEYIEDKSDVIFIDDSFSERYAVKKNRPNVHVFSPEAIESLLD